MNKTSVKDVKVTCKTKSLIFSAEIKLKSPSQFPRHCEFGVYPPSPLLHFYIKTLTYNSIFCGRF